MCDYMISCMEQQILYQINYPLLERQMPTLPAAIDISNKFWDTLKLSFKAALLRKRKVRIEEMRDSITWMEKKMDKLYKDVISSMETKFDDVMALATSYCNMGIVYKDYKTKKELFIGQHHLKKCLTVLEGKELEPKAILIVMRASVQLSVISRELVKPRKGLPFVSKAIGLYSAYTKHLDDFPQPFFIHSAKIDIEDDKQKNPKILLVALYSKLLEYISGINSHDLHDVSALVVIGHDFLNHEARIAIIQLCQKGMPWACAVAELSQYFSVYYHFTEARNCLAAAEYMVTAYDKEALKIIETKGCPPEILYNRIYYFVKGIIAASWATYKKSILLISRYNLLYDENYGPRLNNLVTPLMFTKLEEVIKDISRRTNTCVSTFDEAKEVFVYCIKWYNVAIDYFTKIKQNQFILNASFDIITAHRLLAFFEPDNDKRIKLYKRQRLLLQRSIYMYRMLQNDSDTSMRIFFWKISINTTLLDMIVEKAEIAGKPLQEIRRNIGDLVTECLMYHKLFITKSQLNLNERNDEFSFLDSS